MTAIRLSAEEQHSLCQEISAALTERLTEWDAIRFTWCSIGGYATEAVLFVRKTASDVYYGYNVPDTASKLCGRLKRGMYDPRVGTWFEMKLEMRSGEPFEVTFDYDNEPRGVFLPEHWAKELARFPRESSHIPDWLQKQLDQVPNLYMGIYPDPSRRQGDPFTPGIPEIVEAFKAHGWSVGPGQYPGEAELSTGWARLWSLSNPQVFRFSGRLAPERWDDLVSLLTEMGWNFGAELRDGDQVVHNVDPARPTSVEPSSENESEM